MTEPTKFHTQVRQSDDDDLDENEFKALITSPSEDRHGTSVDPDGVDVSAYMTNPVVLYQHDQRSLPIGRVTGLQRTPDGLEATFRIDGETELERTIIAKMNSGTLSGVSIGFISRDEEMRDDGVVNIKEAELVELSVVTIGSNPDAVVTSRSLIDDHMETKNVDRQKREGKVLSRKNREAIKEISTLANGILDRASDGPDEPKNDDDKEDKTIADLTKRIAELESRIAELESEDHSTSDNKDEKSSDGSTGRNTPDEIIEQLQDRLNI